uniref:Uncharacterized protein n=1 Tax=viral metagenome TaxID=1070528 RepID=A0A6C0EZ59_9ZZZZ
MASVGNKIRGRPAKATGRNVNMNLEQEDFQDTEDAMLKMAIDESYASNLHVLINGSGTIKNRKEQEEFDSIIARSLRKEEESEKNEKEKINMENIKASEELIRKLLEEDNQYDVHRNFNQGLEDDMYDDMDYDLDYDFSSGSISSGSGGSNSNINTRVVNSYSSIREEREEQDREYEETLRNDIERENRKEMEMNMENKFEDNQYEDNQKVDNNDHDDVDNVDDVDDFDDEIEEEQEKLEIPKTFADLRAARLAFFNKK